MLLPLLGCILLLEQTMCSHTLAHTVLFHGIPSPHAKVFPVLQRPDIITFIRSCLIPPNLIQSLPLINLYHFILAICILILVHLEGRTVVYFEQQNILYHIVGHLFSKYASYKINE